MPAKSLKPRLMSSAAPQVKAPKPAKVPQRDGLAKVAKSLSKRFIGG